MELTQAEIDHLYSDSSLKAYRPEAVLTEVTDGSTLPALCFNLVEPPQPEECNHHYAAKLRALAERLQLPQHYVDTIE
jgi:hypothetical protein